MYFPFEHVIEFNYLKLLNSEETKLAWLILIIFYVIRHGSLTPALHFEINIRMDENGVMRARASVDGKPK